jgi:hypothetical protein
MFEDGDKWPIKCPICKDEFTEKVGSMKAGKELRCSSGHRISYDKEKLPLELAEASEAPLTHGATCSASIDPRSSLPVSTRAAVPQGRVARVKI